MSLTLAVAAGLGSALAYGAGTAGQHAVGLHRSAARRRRLLRSWLRNPRWLLASAGDVVGVGLQVLALANGAVVLVQPLLVLSLPVAVLLRSSFGGPRPSAADCAQLCRAGPAAWRCSSCCSVSPAGAG